MKNIDSVIMEYKDWQQWGKDPEPESRHNIK